MTICMPLLITDTVFYQSKPVGYILNRSAGHAANENGCSLFILHERLRLYFLTTFQFGKSAATFKNSV